MNKKFVIILFSLIFLMSILILGKNTKIHGKEDTSFKYHFSNEIIPVSELHNNDIYGVPILIGQIVTISGEVTVADQFYLPANIEDETAGVAVYDANFASTVKIGDYVTITGTVDQYYGLTELKDVNIIEHTANSPSVEPYLVTCRDIATDGSGGIEKFEGELVKLNSVTVNTQKWSVSGSGTNFVLTDDTGSCEVRIDNDTDIANTSAPSGIFDIIGVISQYDRTSPFTEGYQLMPRYNEDIILPFGPRLLSGPIEKDMTPNSLKITWSTAQPANSIIMYGKTTNYEIDSLTIEESVTQHEMMITGLSPAAIYHVKVGSADSTGTNYFFDHLVITASDPSSTGEVNIYFNRNVDQSLALPGNEMQGRQNLFRRFIERIDSANYSIDLCFYHLNLQDLTDAVINAYNRGIKIRFICDNTYYSNEIDQLSHAGIHVIDDAFGSNDGIEEQHNKFAIFDARDDTFASDDWVWTGSLNMTDSDLGGIYAIQNSIEIQDQSLAKAYTMEFNEMWGSEGDTPNAKLSRFGPNKLDDIPHRFMIKNKLFELYMCPSDHATSKIIDVVQSADYEIYFCILAFTRYDLESAIRTKFFSIDGFKLRGVFDSAPDQYSRWYQMHGTGDYPWSPTADVWLDNEPGTLHHKYMLIDVEHPNSDPIVITGSQNWSTSAEIENDENTLIIHDDTIANQYLQEFASRYHAAGGTGAFTTNVEDKNSHNLIHSFTLYQNYPNPFNGETIIPFAIHQKEYVYLELFDINGRLVETLINKYLEPQEYEYRIFIPHLPSGIYFYKLKSGHKQDVKKMALVK